MINKCKICGKEFKAQQKNHNICFNEDNSNETIVESVEKCKTAWKEFKEELFQSAKTIFKK